MTIQTLPALIAAFTVASPETARTIFESCSPALLKFLEPTTDGLVLQAPALDCDGGTRGDLHGRGNSEHGIKLVGGNGEEIISDWTYSTGDADGFNAFMEGFKAEDNY